MTWLWIGAVLGIAAPWVAIPGAIRSAFADKGFARGIGYWLGMATVTVPLFIGLMWLGQRYLF